LDVPEKQNRYQINNTDNIHKLNTTQKKIEQCKIQQTKNYPGSVAFYDTRPGNDEG